MGIVRQKLIEGLEAALASLTSGVSSAQTAATAAGNGLSTHVADTGAHTALSSATPTTITTSAAAAGSGSTAARADHRHDLGNGSVILANHADIATLSLYARLLDGNGPPAALAREQAMSLLSMPAPIARIALASGWAQRSFISRRFGMMMPRTGVSMDFLGMNEAQYGGTRSTSVIADTNFKTTHKYLQIPTTASTANSAGGNVCATNGGAGEFLRGGAAGRGGFYWFERFSVSSTTAGQRVFVGLAATVAAIAGSSTITDLVNMIGFGWRAADTELHFFHNDGSGTATAIPLGASLPSNDTTAVYDVFLFSAPNGSDIYYYVRRADTGTEVSGNVSSDIPSQSTVLALHNHINTGTTGGTVSQIDIARAIIDA